MATKKAAKKVVKKAAKKPAKKSNPTQRQCRTGDAHRVPRSALVRCLRHKSRAGIAIELSLGMER